MVTDSVSNGSTPRALPAFDHPSMHGLQHGPKNSRSAPDSHSHSLRRHSLPLHFLPPNLWTANVSSASLLESEQAARGEHSLDEAAVAHRISALRQLNGTASSRHRYAKSTGAQNTTFSSPVIVRTYSGAARPASKQREIVTVREKNGLPGMGSGKTELKMPPVEAFTFKGIMDEIRHGVAEDLERIAEICARSKYSLSNQYEVHMPPHGRGEPYLQATGLGVGPNPVAGPTLQVVGSDDEQPRHIGRRGGRRTKSVAYGTLETIMSSSRSSEEDKSKKKAAAVIAEEVRGRAAQIEQEISPQDGTGTAIQVGPASEHHSKHVRSKSASFASMIMDNAQGSNQESISQLVSPISLISEPARPKTSTTLDPVVAPVFEPIQLASPYFQSLMSSKPTLIRNESIASILRPNVESRPSILGTFGSWLPWSRTSTSSDRGYQARNRSASHAEGSLRELLKSANVDVKGKSVNRSG